MKYFLFAITAIICSVSILSCGLSDHYGHYGGGNGETPVSRGHIIRTTNEGVSWTTSNVPNNNRAYDGTFCEPNTYIVTVDSGKVIRSTDDGVNWTFSDASPGQILSYVSSGSPDHAVAVAYQGEIVYTSDGGITWKLVTSIPTTATLLHVNMSLDPIGYIAANNSILKTINRGVTWSAIQVMNAVGFTDVDYAAGGSTLLVSSNNGKVYRSSDAGITWTSQTINPSGGSLNAINIESDGRTVNCLGDGGKIYHSNDAGITWTDVSVPSVTTSLKDIDGNYYDLFIVGSGGTLLKSTDQGATWVKQTSPGAYDLVSLSFKDESNAIIVANN